MFIISLFLFQFFLGNKYENYFPTISFSRNDIKNSLIFYM